ncbi:MAG: hypothetical protein NC131_09145 [Roseburia sp.]|nr:hypothetical protein [Roseburia sp.]
MRQLRDEGIIEEQAPGLYNLRQTVGRYIAYIRKGNTNLNDERALLTKAKREAAEMENEARRGELHRVTDIEAGIKSLCLNLRSNLLILPARLSPTLANMGGNQEGIFDELKRAIDEALEELSNPAEAMAKIQGESESEEEA